MIAELLVMIVLPLLLAVAAGWDLASFTIPNFLSAAIWWRALCCSPPRRIWRWPSIGWHLLAGLLGLFVGFGLFALGYIGGGDAKLFGAVTLWLGFHDLMSYALAASLFGGALTLTLLALRHYPLPTGLMQHSWIQRLHGEKAAIPYGVALAAGAFAVLPQAEVFRLAAGI